jgi:pimeloyl-ACP methyl ester carboxylesterase
VLDAARAARALDGAHANDQLLLWGHSQGGQAALFAAQLAPKYAPDLHLRAVAVAAPAVELAQLLRDDITGVAGVSLGAYAFDAYHRVYGPTVAGAADLTSILTPSGARATPAMARLCLFGQMPELHEIARPLVGHYLADDPGKVAPWSTLLEQNTPGGAPIRVPVYVAQGDEDTLVVPATTTAYVRELCEAGETVRYERYAGETHAFIALRAAGTVVDWFADALAGRAPHGTCADPGYRHNR